MGVALLVAAVLSTVASCIVDKRLPGVVAASSGVAPESHGVEGYVVGVDLASGSGGAVQVAVAPLDLDSGSVVLVPALPSFLALHEDGTMVVGDSGTPGSMTVDVHHLLAAR
jgi:hypothetical protein